MGIAGVAAAGRQGRDRRLFLRAGPCASAAQMAAASAAWADAQPGDPGGLRIVGGGQTGTFPVGYRNMQPGSFGEVAGIGAKTV